MVAAPAAAELRAEVGTLNLVVLTDLAPGGVADCAGDIDFESQDRHKYQFTTEDTEDTEQHRELKRNPRTVSNQLSSASSVSSVVSPNYAETTGTA